MLGGNSELILQNGIDLDTVAEVGRELGFPEISKIYSSTGQPGLLFRIGPDAAFIATTFACDAGICNGLHMFVLIQGSGRTGDSVDLNAFNQQRPQGNAAFDPSADTFIVQRVATSFNGITREHLGNELGAIIGYAASFAIWLSQQQPMTAVSADGPVAADSKIDNVLSADRPDDPTTDAVAFAMGLMDNAAPFSTIDAMATVDWELP